MCLSITIDKIRKKEDHEEEEEEEEEEVWPGGGLMRGDALQNAKGEEQE